MMHGMDHSAHNAPMSSETPKDESLIDILRRRYALGEITRDQFEEMKQVLGLSEGMAVAPASDMYARH